MPYAIVLRDAPGSGAPRREHLESHLAFVESMLDRILVAGPLTDPATGRQCGSLYVLDVPDEAAARAFLDTDPYHAAGVWESAKIESFGAVAGRWVGGTAWKKR